MEKGQCACFTEQGCTCPFHGRKSKGHRDVPVKICQKSGNERTFTALGSKFAFEGSSRVFREDFSVEVIFGVKGLEGWLLERSNNSPENT